MARLADRVRRLVHAVEDYKVTLVCNRCGFEVEVADDGPTVLVAQAAGQGFINITQDEASQRDLDAVLSHPCSGTGSVRGGKPWRFRTKEPGADGTLAELAAVLEESRERAEQAEPDA